MLFSNQKACFDVIAVGRATIDIYSKDIGDLVNSINFIKYLGGSPANTAIAMSKLGLKVGFITKVSNDGLGEFVKNYFKEHSVDISEISYDHFHKTGITVGEIKEKGQCSCIVYREKCADLFLNTNDINSQYLLKTKSILISGTSLSHSPAREAILKILRIAKYNNITVIFDPDYREGTWDNPDECSEYLSLVASLSDIVISTEDEFKIVFKSFFEKDQVIDIQKCIDYLISKGVSLINIKKGQKGSCVYTKNEKVEALSFHINNVVKTFGAGDSYAAGFIFSLLNHKSLQEAQLIGSACAAITISGHSCSESSPTIDVLNEFLRLHKP